jgi:hypothetical protein
VERRGGGGETTIGVGDFAFRLAAAALLRQRVLRVVERVRKSLLVRGC